MDITVESNPPIINTNSRSGFDFYRMRDLDQINPYTGKSKYNDLQDYIDEYKKTDDLSVHIKIKIIFFLCDSQNPEIKNNFP